LVQRKHFFKLNLRRLIDKFVPIITLLLCLTQ
jgi:hypothetical protein